ncbi:MAG: hypothetical protein R3F28_11550 [Candidatus Kapaibacterium sp.]
MRAFQDFVCCGKLRDGSSSIAAPNAIARRVRRASLSMPMTIDFYHLRDSINSGCFIPPIYSLLYLWVNFRTSSRVW